jgi:hypothetical protein
MTDIESNDKLGIARTDVAKVKFAEDQEDIGDKLTRCQLPIGEQDIDVSGSSCQRASRCTTQVGMITMTPGAIGCPATSVALAACRSSA